MSQTMDPVSPPESPITASPAAGHKPLPNIHSQHSQIRNTFTAAQRFASSESRGAQYSIVPGPVRSTNFRPDELSPRSSSSSIINGIAENNVIIDIDVDKEYEDIDNDADDDENDDSDKNALPSDSDDSVASSGMRSPASVRMTGTSNSSRQSPNTRRGTGGSISPAYTSLPRTNISPSATSRAKHFTAELYVDEVETTIIIEECFDFDSDNGRIQVMQPFSIEEAESERELAPDPKRNRSGKLKPRRRLSSCFRMPPDLDRSVMSGLRGFTFRGDDDDEEAIDDNDEDADFDQFRQAQREEKRRRRLTSGSISKRTITESIGSGSDYEDVSDSNEAGSSARRMRRRVERQSILFTDPPAPRIDECDEPDTSDNEDDVKELTLDGENLARELPYYTLEYISMQVDSP